MACEGREAFPRVSLSNFSNALEIDVTRMSRVGLRKRVRLASGAAMVRMGS